MEFKPEFFDPKTATLDTPLRPSTFRGDRVQRVAPPPSTSPEHPFVMTIDGYQVTVDAADAHLLTRHKWYVRKLNGVPLALRPHNGAQLMLHRVVLGVKDHRKVFAHNGNFLDCRRSNLRVSSGLNLPSQKSGVWRDRGKWVPWVKLGDRVQTLGRYDDKLEANHALDCWRLKRFPAPRPRSAQSIAEYAALVRADYVSSRTLPPPLTQASFDSGLREDVKASDAIQEALDKLGQPNSNWVTIDAVQRPQDGSTAMLMDYWAGDTIGGHYVLADGFRDQETADAWLRSLAGAYRERHNWQRRYYRMLAFALVLAFSIALIAAYVYLGTV